MVMLKRFFLILALLATPLFASASPVDINTADAQTLADTLQGVGLQKAQAIIAYRDKHGPFQSVEELLKVGGIGEKTLELNRDRITAGTSAASK